MERVKHYLSQALQLDSRIDSKLEQLQSLRALATKTSSTLSGMPRNTPNAQSMEAIVVKIVDLEAEISADIDNLLKSLMDGLNGVARHDDKQVVSVSAERGMSYDERVEVEINYKDV